VIGRGRESPRKTRGRADRAFGPTSASLEASRRSLLRWYRRHRRPLPWRKTSDPYRIWVSEVLLQQTPVTTALRYYRSFLRRFPTLSLLARAPLRDVLKTWEGAGYYARARLMRSAARVLLRKASGHWPRQSDQLRTLPGFGPYMSCSLAALAFGERVVALDTNGRRVLSRLFLIRDPLTSRHTEVRLRDLGTALLGRASPRDFNEALMELGQRICRPNQPRCSECPLARTCLARQELPDPALLPARRGRPRRPHVRASVAIIPWRGRVLVAPRPPSGLLGGLYEFPGGKVQPGESPEEAVVREVREEVGVAPACPPHLLGRLEHDYSHFHVSLHVFALPVRDARRVSGVRRRWRWVTGEELRRLPLPAATRKMWPWVTEVLSAPPRPSPPATCPG